MFVAGQDGAVYKWNGNTWLNRGGARITDISVTADGAPVAITDSHEIWVGQP